jgi:hypothetical protein
MTPWHEDMAGKLDEAASWLKQDLKMPGLAEACAAGSAAILGAHSRDNEVFEARQEAEKLKAEVEQLKKTATPEASRRERIATAAMQGLLATDAYGVHASTVLARDSVQLADALIAELDKGDK